MSMTWTTLTSLSFLSTSFWTQAWSPVSSSESPQIRPLLGAFERHLPDLFVCSVEDPIQSLVLRRIELPHVETPSLARENPADEHDLDYVDKLELLVHQLLDAGLESG